MKNTVQLDRRYFCHFEEKKKEKKGKEKSPGHVLPTSLYRIHLMQPEELQSNMVWIFQFSPSFYTQPLENSELQEDFWKSGYSACVVYFNFKQVK